MGNLCVVIVRRFSASPALLIAAAQPVYCTHQPIVELDSSFGEIICFPLQISVLWVAVNVRENGIELKVMKVNVKLDT